MQVLIINNKYNNILKNRLRLSVFKSKKNLSAQIIDDFSNNTLVSFSTLQISKVSKYFKKKEIYFLGFLFGLNIKNNGINKIFFDKKKSTFRGVIPFFIKGIQNSGIFI